MRKNEPITKKMKTYSKMLIVSKNMPKQIRHANSLLVIPRVKKPQTKTSLNERR